MTVFTLLTHDDHGILKETTLDIPRAKKSLSPSEMIDRFSDRCTSLMWGITEEAIESLVPEGVSAKSWLRRHLATVEVSGIADGVRHTILKDDEIVGEIKYKDGKVLARIFMGRGVE